MPRRLVNKGAFDELSSRLDNLDFDKAFNKASESLDHKMAEMESRMNKVGRILDKKVHITNKTIERVAPNFEVNRKRNKRLRKTVIVFIVFQVVILLAAVVGLMTKTDTDSQIESPPTAPPAFEQPIEKPDILNKL